MKQHELFGAGPEEAPGGTRERPERRRAAAAEPEAGAVSPARPERQDPGQDPDPAEAPQETAGDAEARRRAVTEFDRPLLLEAGAGTGKTATLVARVVHWCLGPGWEAARGGDRGVSGEELAREALATRVLRGVAAVTFTEAAAAEMSTRVGQALAAVQRFAGGRGALPPGFVRAALCADAAELGARAEALRGALDQLDVSTIHAFCRRILAAHPLEAGFDPDFEVDASFQQAELAVRDAIEELLHGDWESGQDRDWIELARRGIGPPEVEAAAVELVTDRGARAADFERDPLPAEACARARDELDRAAGELLAATAGLGGLRTHQRLNVRFLLEALDGTAAVLAAAPGAHSAGGDERAAFEALAERLRPIWKQGEGVKGRDRLSDWAKRGLNKTEARAADDPEALRPLAAALRAALAPFLDLDLELIEHARRVLARVLGRVEQLLRHRGVATFQDLITSTRELLRDPRVAARERARFRQLLVDEFQDTDQEQCEIVAALALEGEERPGLFLVGDPKQSIFAWRSADLAAYAELAERLERAGGERLTLDANFRSHAAILEEVARVVDPVMEAVPGLQPPFVPLVPAGPDARAALSGPAVEHWISWPRDPETGAVAVGDAQGRGASYASEARALARDMTRWHAAGTDWKQLALIVRSMTGIEDYLSELREAGVPYEVQSDRKYYQRREVVDAASLVRALLDPTDHVALLGLLRSPSVGLPDAALFPLWEAGFPGALTWLGRLDEERLARLDALIEEAAARVPSSVPGLAALEGWPELLKEAVRAIAELRESFRRDPVDRFVERLRLRLLPDVTEAARYLGEFRLANLERFFRDLVRSLEDAHGDAHRVLRALRANVGRTDRSEASRPADSGRDAVAVLTIHGAKGLEFEHVYLAQTHRAAASDKGDKLGFERRRGEVAYRVFGAPTLSWVLGQDRREEIEAAERVRLLYVTLTRARRRLVVLGAWPLEPGPRDWRRAGTANELCRSRAEAAAAVRAVAAGISAGRPEPVLDRFGVAWRLAELDPGSGGPAALASLEAASAEVERIVDEAGALAADRARAARRMERPYSRAASAEAHLEAVEHTASRRFASGASEASAPLGRGAALAAGTALHRLLEDLDLEGDPRALWGAGRARLPALVGALAPAAHRERALARAEELFERIERGGLLGRLAELGAEGVLARELPVLLPPSDGGGDDRAAAPVGFVAGAVDLVYRDPGSGAVVVADYKSDAAEGDEALAALAAAYAPQGAAYTRAVQAALGLGQEPRFELWFLHAGVVVAP